MTIWNFTKLTVPMLI